MQTLVISDSNPIKDLHAQDVIYTGGPLAALELLETKDIDRIVFDTRTQGIDAEPALINLIARLPVTTRLLAIVEHLPSSPMCSDAGVVYLTPPVNHADISWFLGLSEVNRPA